MSVIQVSKFAYTSTYLSRSLANTMNTKKNMSGDSCIMELFGFYKGGNFNIHIWAWFGYFICSKREIRFYLLVKSYCFSHANKRDFHENPDHIYTELTFINPLSVYYKNRMPLYSAGIFEDPSIYSVDPDQTASIGSIWSGSTLYASIVMLTNKQTFFRM